MKRSEYMFAEKSLKKSFVIYGIKTIFALIFPLLSFRIVATSLGVEATGQIQFSQSIVGYFQLFASLGISSYAIREGAKVRDDEIKLGKLCSELIIINSISVLISYSCFITALFCLDSLSKYKLLLMILGVDIIFLPLSLEWLYNILEEYTYITVRYSILQVVAFILIIMLVNGSEDKFLYTIILVLISAASMLLNFFYSRKHVRLFKYKQYEIKKHLKPILTIFGASIASSICLNLDTTMLGILADDRAVGLYAAASKLKKSIASIITTVLNVFLPRLSFYLTNRNKEQYDSLLAKVFNMVLAISIPIAVGLAMLSEESIYILSGSDFLEASSVAKIQSISILFSAVNSILVWHILMPHKKEHIVLFSTVVSLLVTFFCNVWLIPIVGIYGAVFANIASEIFILVISMYAIKSVDLSMKRMFAYSYQYVLASVCIIPICLFAQNTLKNTLGIVAISVLLSVATYSIVLLLMKNPYAQECYNLMKRRVKK